MIIRAILGTVIVLAILPDTRPIVFGTLGNIANEITAVLLVIWATSSASGTRWALRQEEKRAHSPHVFRQYSAIVCLRSALPLRVCRSVVE
jgi:hypothetical protein